MPDAVYSDAVTCPANTPTTAPHEVVLSVTDPIIPRKVTITIPDGHAGLTGIAIAFGHNAVIPANTDGWISGNDDFIPFDLSGYPNGVSWSVLLCNNDSIAHVWQVLFEGDLLPSASGGAVSRPINTGELAALQEQTLGGP